MSESNGTSTTAASAGSQDWDMVDATVDATDAPSTPSASLKLSIQPRHDVIGTGTGLGTTQVCATIKARTLPDDETKRAPVDIMVALDVSGSMHGDKLALCKTSLKLLLRQLLNGDRFGLVSFSDDAIVEVPLQPLTEDHRKKSLDKIERLETRGCTNISDAIGTVVPLLQMMESPNEVRTVFLLTDGLANRGISNEPDLVNLTQNWFSASDDVEKGVNSPPITLHCFGYGSDHSSSLLQKMAATTAGGTYYFVENDSNVLGAFGDALGGILSVVAQTAVLHITVPDEAKNLGVDIVDVYHDKKVKMEDGSYTVTIGDFYAEESRDILFEIKLAAAMGGQDPIPHTSVTLSYTDTLLKCPAVPSRAVCNIARPLGSELSPPSQYILVQWLRIQTVGEMAEAEKMSRNGQLDEARTKLDKMVKSIQSEPTVQSDPLVEHLVQDLERLKAGLQSNATYRQFGVQCFSHAHQTHERQRCSGSSTADHNAYRSSRKAFYSKKFGA